jgi:hypothetical protein
MQKRYKKRAFRGVRAKLQFLKDNGDAKRVGVTDGADENFLPLYVNITGVRMADTRHDLHQRRFARTVLIGAAYGGC